METRILDAKSTTAPTQQTKIAEQIQLVSVYNKIDINTLKITQHGQEKLLSWHVLNKCNKKLLKHLLLLGMEFKDMPPGVNEFYIQCQKEISFYLDAQSSTVLNPDSACFFFQRFAVSKDLYKSDIKTQNHVADTKEQIQSHNSLFELPEDIRKKIAVSAKVLDPDLIGIPEKILLNAIKKHSLNKPAPTEINKKTGYACNTRIQRSLSKAIHKSRNH